MSDRPANEVEAHQRQPGTDPMSPGDEVPPGTTGAGENLCSTCSGSGRVNNKTCPTCNGTGKILTAVGGA